MTACAPSLVVAHAPVSDAELRRLCRRLQDLTATGVQGDVLCHVAASATADLATVAVLARLQREARRLTATLRFCGGSPALRDVIALVGLAAVVPVELCVESRR